MGKQKTKSERKKECTEEEIETQKQQHDARVMAIRTEEKQKIDKMADDLDEKWRDALREEVRLLKEELSEEYEADKQAALTQLSQQKELELMAAREGWQRKVEDLLEQISLLKQSLELQLSQSQSALQQLQSQFSQERELLSQQLKEMQREHQRREHRLQEAHCCALSTMEEARQHQIRALEERLKQEHREEVHALKEAHRRTLEILRQQSEQELQTLRFELEDEGKAKLASLRAELNHLHATAIEHLKQIHLKEKSAAKRELDKAMEHSHQQEQELLVRISDLQAELCSRSNRITDLDHEIHSLNETIDTLTRELELKGKEVLRVRSEANHQIRAHEQDLIKRHDRDLDELKVVHHREMQIMLADFNKAQEVLKDKISALQILLEGTEEKLRNRESRPEDLHLIAELREMVTEREVLVKKLVDDKKFYQLELVNRETGFNKVFNSSANVGVINPLIKSKTSSQSDQRLTSFPSHSALRFVSPPTMSQEGQEEGGREAEEVGPGGRFALPHSPLQRSLPRHKKALPLFSPLASSPLPQHPPLPHPPHHPMPSLAPPHAPQDPLVQHQGLQSCGR
ncbi:hypothetical protein AMECASPLE_011607 [Ameca splendens]|uniref:Uncharacterized protein n=2 Tax=Goodeidae TaxID=28758 RepID=A0ABV0YC79_9TELE